ncbi:SpaA isopeptide-forming pilin-related protein [Pseudoclavibacter soli]|uniref:SpaA isopeptide-forming pilin-related protein n=1 Tax=Pseudoclavibacter soli TaxID=452623 RepID=UPI000423E2DB|nr:SpaA isopeptide-forming pilin-related protein [Pseudoclavibacter soli]
MSTALAATVVLSTFLPSSSLTAIASENVIDSTATSETTSLDSAAETSDGTATTDGAETSATSETDESTGTDDASGDSAGTSAQTQSLGATALAATEATEETSDSNDVNAPGVDPVVNPSGEAGGPLPTVTSSWVTTGSTSGSTRTFTITYENKGSTAITNGRIWHQFMARVGHSTAYSVSCAASGTSCPTNGTNAGIPSGTNTITGSDHIYYRTFWAVVDIPAGASLTFTITTTTTTTTCADSTTPMIGGWARFSRTGFNMPDDIDASASNAGVITGVTQCGDGTVAMTNATASPLTNGTPVRVLSGDQRTFTATWTNTSSTASVTVPIRYTYYVPYTGQVTQATWSCAMSGGGSCPTWATNTAGRTVNHDNAGEDPDVIFGDAGTPNLNGATVTDNGINVTLAASQSITFTITLATTINTCTQDGYLRVQTYAERGATEGETGTYRKSAPSELVEIGCSTWLMDETFSGTSVSDSAWKGLNEACLTKSTGAATSGTVLGSCTNRTRVPATNFNSGSTGLPAGYLKLTDDSTDKVGAALYDRALPSKNGLVLEFTQYQFGNSTDGDAADGIGFFLTDGAYSLTSAGSKGGALGYANKSSDDGLAHAYLGVGFDEFGNFADTSTDITPQCYSGTPTPKKNAVTLRGPGNGQTGYCVVGATKKVTDLNASYSLRAQRTGTSYTNANMQSVLQASARKTRVTVYPLKDGETNPTVTVEMDFGDGYVTVLSETMTAAAPDLIKFGFLGSTGGSRDTHLISSVRVGTVLPMESLDLVKSIDPTASSYQADGTYDVAQQIPYMFTATNTSESSIFDFTLTDAQLDAAATCTPSTGEIAAGGSVTCTGVHTVTTSDQSSGQVVNTATAKAKTSATGEYNLTATDTKTVAVNPTADDASRVISPGGTTTFQVVDNGSTAGIVTPDDASKLTIEVYNPNTSQWVTVPASGAADVSITATNTSSETEGTWTIKAGNTVTFTGANGYTGTVTDLKYRATNAYGGTDEGLLKVTINVNPLNVCTSAEQAASDSVWAFGDDARFDWDTSTQAVTAGTFSDLSGASSTFTVTDSTGELQFVVDSDGTIRSADGTAMTDTNSSAVSLGTLTGASPVTAFPAAQGTGKYYVVWSTAGSTASDAGQLKYRIVDMTKNNGAGAIETAEGTLSSSNASTAVTAVPNADGTGYWVINPQKVNANISGDAYTIDTYLFHASGFTGTHTVSSDLGYSVVSSTSSYPASEDIVFTSDYGRFVAMASEDGLTDTSYVYVLSFDALNGEFTFIHDHSATLLTGVGYSVALSPDDAYVYWALTGSTNRVYRHALNDNLTWTFGSAIHSSGYGGAIRLGADDRLYWAQSGQSSVPVLTNPEASSGLNWTTQSLAGGTTSTAGLTNTLTDCGISPTGFKVQKNDSSGAAVDGAEFALYPDNGNGAASDTATEATFTAVSGSTGLFSIDDLAPGRYWLRETKAPSGHSLLAQDVRVDIELRGGVAVATTSNPQVTLSGDATTGYTITVTDTAAMGLPLTGGQWAALLTALGILLLAAAAAGTAWWRRRAGVRLATTSGVQPAPGQNPSDGGDAH